MSSIISVSPVRFAPAAVARAQIAYRQYGLKPRNAILSSNIILAHATSLCKEVYKQFLGHLKTIEGEAIAWDMRNNGDSCVANLELFKLGEAWPETCIDGARDTLALLDHIKLDSSKPLIGIGHSMGSTNLLFAEINRPNTFSAIIAIDPVISTVDLDLVLQGKAQPDGTRSGIYISHMARKRRATWESREEASKYLHNRGMYEGWTSEAMDAFIKYGLRDLEDGSGVTLKCPPEQEEHCYKSGSSYLYTVFKRLPEIKIPVLFIGTECSEYIPPKNVQTMCAQCPRGEVLIVNKLKHMMPLQDPATIAQHIDDFIARHQAELTKVPSFHQAEPNTATTAKL